MHMYIWVYYVHIRDIYLSVMAFPSSGSDRDLVAHVMVTVTVTVTGSKHMDIQCPWSWPGRSSHGHSHSHGSKHIFLIQSFFTSVDTGQRYSSGFLKAPARARWGFWVRLTVTITGLRFWVRLRLGLFAALWRLGEAPVVLDSGLNKGHIHVL